MSLLSWSMSALAACVMAYTAAQPTPRVVVPRVDAPSAPSASAPDALLARIEREVTRTLRAQHEDRWRFSRVHRPTPRLRTVRDPERSTPRHEAFRILSTPWAGGAEVEAHRVRVERASGAIEIAPGGLAAGAPPVYAPFAPTPRLLDAER